MVDSNLNSEVDRVQVYDSYVQLISGANRYRLKSLQKFDPQLLWPNLIRVADDGTVYLNQQSIAHEVEIDITLTSDEVDTVSPPTNTRTISYFMYQKYLRNHVELAVSSVYYAKDSASNNYLRFNCTFEVIGIGLPRINGEGDVTATIRGMIIEIDHTGADVHPSFIRQSS